MKRTILGAIALAGLAGTIAVPTIVSGNARRTGAGSLAELQLAETPFIASLSGTNERPGPGDPDGTGDAAPVLFVLRAGADVEHDGRNFIR